MKSAAYIQSWHTDKLSKIIFNIGAKRKYDYSTRKYSTTIQRNADVYVFCLLKEKDVDNLDPLNLGHWEFYIVFTRELDEHFPEQKTISLATLEKVAQRTPYDGIKLILDRLMD